MPRSSYLRERKKKTKKTKKKETKRKKEEKPKKKKQNVSVFTPVGTVHPARWNFWFRIPTPKKLSGRGSRRESRSKVPSFRECLTDVRGGRCLETIEIHGHARTRTHTRIHTQEINRGTSVGKRVVSCMYVCEGFCQWTRVENRYAKSNLVPKKDEFALLPKVTHSCGGTFDWKSCWTFLLPF